MNSTIVTCLSSYVITQLSLSYLWHENRTIGYRLSPQKMITLHFVWSFHCIASSIPLQLDWFHCIVWLRYFCWLMKIHIPQHNKIQILSLSSTWEHPNKIKRINFCWFFDEINFVFLKSMGISLYTKRYRSTFFLTLSKSVFSRKKKKKYCSKKQYNFS